MAQISSVFPMGRQWDRAVDDVSKVPVNAVSIRLVSGAKNIDKLPAYSRLAALWCFDIDARHLDTISNCTVLESLYLENIKTGDLSPLKRLTELKVLGLERCSKLTSLTHLAELDSLQQLNITHFKNVRNLGPLARLKELRALAVAGSIWTTMRVESFQPLEQLSGLEFLHLTNIKPDDGKLDPLARLTNLKKLEIANFYTTSQFARLARQLPSTECQWFKPFVELASPHLRCKKCGEASMAMLTGRGTTTICMACDRPKLEKQIREWTAG